MASEDFDWGISLYDVHLNNTDIDSSCGNCHADSDPRNFTVAGEDIMPAWYASTTNEIVGLTLDPCAATLEEAFSGNPLVLGLDNDGAVRSGRSEPIRERKNSVPR